MKKKPNYKKALEVFDNMAPGIRQLINDAITLENIESKIKSKKESIPFTDEETEFILKHPAMFDRYLKPTYPNGTINHQFLKSFKLKSNNADIHTGYYVNIGFYQNTCKTNKDYTNLSFAVKFTDGGTEHSTSWWIREKDTEKKTFIPNSDIVFEHPEIQKIYLNANYSKLYIE